MRRQCHAVVVILAGLIGLGPAVQEAPAAETVLQATAGDHHVWFVTESGGRNESAELCHHAGVPDRPFYRSQMTLTRKPAAMAAWGDRLWLAYPPDPTAAEPRREVFTLNIVYDEALGTYHVVPADRMTLVDSLPGRGKLMDLVGTADGPVALLCPEQWSGAGVRGAETAVASQPTLERPMLLQLRQQRWMEIPLPDAIDPGMSARLVAAGEHGRDLMLISRNPVQPSRVLLVELKTTGDEWTTTAVDLPMAHVRDVCMVDGRPVLLIQDPSEPRQASLAYLRQGHVLPFCALEVPDGRWAVVGVEDGLRVLRRTSGGSMSIQRIDPITGEAGEFLSMRLPPVPTGGLLQVALLFGATAAALVLVFLIRPAVRQTLPMPPGLLAMPVGARLSALVIDLAPGGVLAVLLTGSSAGALLRLPMWTTDLTDAVPYLLMVGLTIAHVLPSELLRGSTLGKSMMGGKVVSMSGERPSAKAVLVRNGVKMLTFVIPPLAVLVLFSPNLQGLGDILSKTVVVREGESSTVGDD